MSKIPNEFYLQNDVVQIAKQLLGKYLCTHINNKYTAGKIVETEAYKAPEDMASHAYNNRKTKRTIPFYEEGGIAYIYLIYGMYNLFNIVTNSKNIPHAILIRAVEPKKGIKHMKERMGIINGNKKFTAGPGLLTKSLGINISHNMCDLQGKSIWLENDKKDSTNFEIIESKRIGMNIPEPWQSMPWRFYIKNNPWVSRLK